MKLKSTRILRVEQCNNNQEEAHESCPLGSSLTLGRSKSLTTYNRNVSSHVPPLCIPQRPDTPSKSQEFTNSPRLLHHRSRPSPSQSFLSRSASSNQVYKLHRHISSPTNQILFGQYVHRCQYVNII